MMRAVVTILLVQHYNNKFMYYKATTTTTVQSTFEGYVLCIVLCYDVTIEEINYITYFTKKRFKSIKMVKWRQNNFVSNVKCVFSSADRYAEQKWSSQQTRSMKKLLHSKHCFHFLLNTKSCTIIYIILKPVYVYNVRIGISPLTNKQIIMELRASTGSLVKWIR